MTEFFSTPPIEGTFLSCIFLVVGIVLREPVVLALPIRDARNVRPALQRLVWHG
jgi:hypothetical protein